MGVNRSELEAVTCSFKLKLKWLASDSNLVVFSQPSPTLHKNLCNQLSREQLMTEILFEVFLSLHLCRQLNIVVIKVAILINSYLHQFRKFFNWLLSLLLSVFFRSFRVSYWYFVPTGICTIIQHFATERLVWLSFCFEINTLSLLLLIESLTKVIIAVAKIKVLMIILLYYILLTISAVYMYIKMYMFNKKIRINKHVFRLCNTLYMNRKWELHHLL